MEAYILEERHHLIVGRVVGDKEADVSVVEDGSNADQASSTAGNNGHVFPRVLALLSLTMHLIVHSSDSSPERLDAGSRAIFTSGNGDVDMSRTRKRAFNVIIDFRGTLS